jgi:hypothetical protein
MAEAAGEDHNWALPKTHADRQSVEVKSGRPPGSFRFAFGTAGGEHSSIWNVWTNRNDVYLASRGMGADIKVSLHASRQCQFSITSAVFRTQALPNALRHAGKWMLPEIPPDGSLRALQLIFPRSEMRASDEDVAKPITWLPLPLMPNHAGVVDAIFAGPSATDVLPKSSRLVLLASLSLPSRKNLVLGCRVAPLGATDREKIESVRSIEIDGSPVQPRSLTWAYVDSPDDYHGLIEYVASVVQAPRP